MKANTINTQRTQGTWKAVTIKSNGAGDYPGVMNDNQLVASCCTGTNEEMQANAQLIAASPNLLNAAILCESITDKCNNAMLPQHIQELLQSINETLKEAILKAEQ